MNRNEWYNPMITKKVVKVDLNDDSHCSHLLKLLNDYMEDEMGIGQPMPGNLGSKIIEGLRKHNGYLGFFVCVGKDFVALANCNVNYSTWNAQPLLNIHDFIVSPHVRQQGIGLFLLNAIAEYATRQGFCRINLEVRQDNIGAQQLYRKAGYTECESQMFFWEKKLN
ncbi:MAG: GNAT family N-acetyltransferase [Bacteroidia bacterium]|nr:GNAT family N-acetyltransferase [Bacteroidia bacterium]